MPILECAIPDPARDLQRLLTQVPRGRVTTYGDLADALGSRFAARWVGEFLRNHPHDAGCPCHRVVRSTGELGLYLAGATEQKRDRLVAESIDVIGDRVDLNAYRFDAFESERPLRQLVEFQEQLPERLSLEPFPETPELVGGVDVSYTNTGDAVAAYVLVESLSGRLVWSLTIRTPVAFPYIPGLLAFREIPVLLELLRDVALENRLAGVVFVDGNGILHHRRAGIATHLGITANLPTIGIGKTLLCGRVDLQEVSAGEPKPVVYRGEVVGMAVKATHKSRPIFVSPGQQMDVGDATRMTQRLFHGHRLPEPIYLADKLSRAAAKTSPRD